MPLFDLGRQRAEDAFRERRLLEWPLHFASVLRKDGYDLTIRTSGRSNNKRQVYKWNRIKTARGCRNPRSKIKNERKQSIAFQFRVICDLVNGVQPASGEQEQLIREKCARKCPIPFSNKIRISGATNGSGLVGLQGEMPKAAIKQLIAQMYQRRLVVPWTRLSPSTVLSPFASPRLNGAIT